MKYLFNFSVFLFCFTVNCFAQIQETYFGAPISETKNIILEYGISYDNLKKKLPSLQRSNNSKYKLETSCLRFNWDTGKSENISYYTTYSIDLSKGLYSVDYAIVSEDFDLINKLFSEYEDNFNKQYGEADYTRRSGTLYAFWRNRSLVLVAAIRFQTTTEDKVLTITWQSPLPDHRNLIIK